MTGLLALALLLAGCPGRAPKAVVYDLAERLPVAERWSSRETLLFGTPSAEPHLIEGFYREAAREEESFVWAKPEAELALTFEAAAPRTGVLVLAPYEGLPAQSVEVLLNGTRVASFALNEGRHRYRIPLPAEPQRAGENRLRFVFAAAASPHERDPGNPDKRHLAAAFYALSVGAAADAGLEDLLARDAPPVFARTSDSGLPRVVEVGPSVVRYAIRLPRAAELRFTPLAHPAARAAATPVSFRVTLEAHAGAEQELWSATLRDAGPGEVRVQLPGSAGQIVRLGLHVGGATGARFAWGVWEAPRVFGEGEAALLEPGPLSAQDERRADPLRQRLGAVNVLLIVLDAARAREFGAYGYGRATTPEIDRIAGEGVVFERAYTPAVYTLGAMSSLWTSQHPDRHHAEVSYADKLPRDRLTLAEALTARGIHTAGFVANAMAGRALGFERGFSEFHEIYRRFPDLGSRAEAFARLLPDWFDGQRGERFFAYLHFREPHFPYDPPPPFDTLFGPDAPLTRTERRDQEWYKAINQGRRPSPEEIAHLVRLYDGNLAYADAQIGALRRALEASGLWERTAVIIVADHGEQLYEHGYISHSAQVYEQSTQIPLVLRLPGGVTTGERVRGLVDLTDVAPTVMDLFGLAGQPPAAQAFHGRSLLPVVMGAPGKPAVLSRTVWERPVYALRDERYKLIYDTRTGVSQLYDLEADPGEKRDIASADPLRVAYYRETLYHWMSRLRPTGAGSGEQVRMTREQCENLKSLGYLGADVACPVE